MNSVLTPLLAMTAWFLGLSILVQVLQELWKFITSSKSRAFEKALSDFLGPFTVRDLKQDRLLAVRGPFQFRRVSIAGHVLPLNADDLVASIEKSAAEWPRLIKRALEFETTIQKGRPSPPSPALTKTLNALERQIAEGERLQGFTDAPGLAAATLSVGDAERVHNFLMEWRVPQSTAEFDASKVQHAFTHEFFPQAELIARHYDQFLGNFDYQYRRRNLRQTFMLAMLVAVVLNLPFEQIFVRATVIPPEQAVALAEQARSLYQQAETAGDDRDELRAVGNQALAIARGATSLACGSRGAGLSTTAVITTEQSEAMQAAAQNTDTCDSALTVDYVLDPGILWARVSDIRNGSPRFLFGCFLTAILVTFGAPFWNDVSSMLLRAARPSVFQQYTAAPDRPVKAEVV